MFVVDDLLADIDWSAIELKRLFDGNYGAVDSGAISARRSQKNSLTHVGESIRLAPCSKLQVNLPLLYAWSLKQ